MKNLYFCRVVRKNWENPLYQKIINSVLTSPSPAQYSIAISVSQFLSRFIHDEEMREIGNGEWYEWSILGKEMILIEFSVRHDSGRMLEDRLCITLYGSSRMVWRLRIGLESLEFYNEEYYY